MYDENHYICRAGCNAGARSSKKELIANIDTNYDRINFLKTEYLKLVPPGYTINIEFEPEDKIFRTKESIDLRIMRGPNGSTQFTEDWHLTWNSEKLDSMLRLVDWTEETLTTIKNLLLAAHCISIENGEITTIGYARSGMGKYSYKIFDKDLTPGEVKNYNDGGIYIFYKRNIVLEYGGGAIGSQTFPD